MRSRVVRGTLTLLAVAALGTAAYYYWTTLARINASLQSASSFTSARESATRAAFDLRSAQQAYVAAGQNEAFWFERATRSLDALRATLQVLERETTSVAARAALAEVSSAADDFDARDRRVRGYASSGQKLLASDIIFSDGLDLVSRMLSGLDSAAAQAEVETASARAAAAREQIIAVGTCAGVAVLVVLLLAPTGSPRNVTSENGPLESAKPEGMLNLELRPPAAASSSRLPASGARASKQPGIELPTPKKTAAKPSAARPASVPSGSERVPAPLSQPSEKIEDLAAVCSDLARLSDTSTIPAILERAAAALDASGLVLWVADVGRGELLPIAAHGYASNVLSRMQGVSIESENATAGAYRTGLAQMVRGDGSRNGAIAAPLVSPAGPLGVLSLEMRHEGEKRPERLAAATIVASQLATIVSPIKTSADRSIGPSADRSIG